jgi:hypothetical protein
MLPGNRLGAGPSRRIGLCMISVRRRCFVLAVNGERIA